MTDETEEKFGDFVQRNAKTYNEPALVPRDEMWTAIVAARATRRSEAERRRRFVWGAVALAATLVIGVAIGRYGSGSAPAPLASTDSSAQPGAMYDVAAIQHLGRAEALLVSYANPTLDPYADSAITKWSRDLLSSTRLLLDSPAGLDPTRRQLLQDLERVLVQMVQKSPAESDADARALVERSLTRTDMLTRLRATQAAANISGS